VAGLLILKSPPEGGLEGQVDTPGWAAGRHPKVPPALWCSGDSALARPLPGFCRRHGGVVSRWRTSVGEGGFCGERRARDFPSSTMVQFASDVGAGYAGAASEPMSGRLCRRASEPVEPRPVCHGRLLPSVSEKAHGRRTAAGKVVEFSKLAIARRQSLLSLPALSLAEVSRAAILPRADSCPRRRRAGSGGRGRGDWAHVLRAGSGRARRGPHRGSFRVVSCIRTREV